MQDIIKEELKDLLKKEELIAFLFYGTWCDVCEKMMPILDKISEEQSNIELHRINIDKHKKLVSKYHIDSIPTITFLKKGKEIGRLTGSMEEEDILNKLKEM